MKQGRFIVIEGGDGSGKSSAVSWLKTELTDLPVLFTREPGGTDAAEEIRDVIVKNRAEPLEVRTQLFLFEAARTEHVEKKIVPALAAGTHVVCDRFSASSYAYQVIAGNAEHLKDFFLSVDDVARAGLEPDLTILLDVDPEVGLRRKHISGEELNTFDTKELAFYHAVRRGVKEYLAEKPHVIIDAGQTREQVREEVKRVILKTIQS